uniref:Uncharacterized protein n=1 Tax=Arundo donax TaxID=35708 RepID=A0A0A8YTU0_ARUDO
MCMHFDEKNCCFRYWEFNFQPRESLESSVGENNDDFPIIIV